MPARGSGQCAVALGRACRACGADEWVKNTRGTHVCGPCRRRFKRESIRRRREDTPRVLLESARRRALEAGTPFTITVDDVRAAWPPDGRCPALGLTLRRAKGGAAADHSPSLDRLNPAWGYEPGNIAVISTLANRIKNNATVTQLQRVTAYMTAHGLS